MENEVRCAHCGEMLFSDYGTTERKFHSPSKSEYCYVHVRIGYQLERIANYLQRLVEEEPIVRIQ